MNTATDPEPDDHSSEDEEALWELTVGQGGPEDQIAGDFIPTHCWQDALATADGTAQNGFIVLQAPGGDFVQALAQPKGFALEYREWWRKEASPGFRHYRAYRPADDDLPPPDDDPEDRWAMPLETATACFECFSEYPDETPEATDLSWWDVTSEFLNE